MSISESVSRSYQPPQLTVSQIPLNRIFSVCRFSWPKAKSTPKPVSHTWICPEPKEESIANTFLQTKKITELIERSKKKSCCSSSVLQKTALVARVLKNVLFSFRPFSCLASSLWQKEVVAASVLKKLPAWSYREDFEGQEKLKQQDPWQKTKYAKSENLFDAARSDLFAGKNKKYFSTPEQCFLTTPDGQELNGVFFSGKIKKAVIVAIGLTAFYEELSIDFVYDKIVHFLQKECQMPAVFILNTRGIGQSSGISSPLSIALDIYVAHQFVCHKEKLKADDVLIYGHSLGGNYGLRGAHLIQKAHPEARISAVVDRSFLRFSDVLGARFGKIAKKIAEQNALEMNAQEALCSLKGRVLTLVAKRESTIPYSASFAQNVEKDFIDKNLVDVIPLSEDEVGDHHIRAFNQGETKKVANWLNKYFITK
jgi:hypothetical protein